jgi:hypothetical protein
MGVNGLKSLLIFSTILEILSKRDLLDTSGSRCQYLENFKENLAIAN